MAQHSSERPETALPEKGYPPNYRERDVVERDDDEDDFDSWPAYRSFDRSTRKERHRSERGRGVPRDRDEYRAVWARPLLLDKHR
jgi:hypothetical protein